MKLAQHPLLLALSLLSASWSISPVYASPCSLKAATSTADAGVQDLSSSTSSSSAMGRHHHHHWQGSSSASETLATNSTVTLTSTSTSTSMSSSDSAGVMYTPTTVDGSSTSSAAEASSSDAASSSANSAAVAVASSTGMSVTSSTDSFAASSTESSTSTSYTTSGSTTSTSSSSSASAAPSSTLTSSSYPTSSSVSSPGAVVSAAPPTTGGSCPAGFKNTVFNAGVLDPQIENIYQKMKTGAGIDKWISFNIGVNPDPTFADTEAHHHKIVMDYRDVQKGVDLLTGPSPPDVLTIYNEPDFSWAGVTLTCTPQEAAAALKPILALTGLKTKLIPPTIAYTNSGWLEDFFTACNCADRFDTLGMHAYNEDPKVVQAIATTFHNKYPDKKIWITELAPSTDPVACKMSEAQVIAWMNEMVTWAAATGWVERVYWNQATSANGVQWGSCRPDLALPDGTLTPVGQAYAALCR